MLAIELVSFTIHSSVPLMLCPNNECRTARFYLLIQPQPSPEGPAMETNYVLIDLENVQPESLDYLAPDHFKILVFVGASQTKLPSKMAMFLQRLGDRANYIEISANGPNALDFHIAYYLGCLVTADSSAYFHIISKDTGYDPLIDHLNTQNIRVRRQETISDIPLVKISISRSSKSLAAERIETIVAKLHQLKTAKPRTIKTLSSTIAALFRKQLSEKDVSRLIHELAKRGYLTVSSTKIKYALPSDA